ncbi:MAG: hypothetical protein AB7V50_01790 [Vampirovibrionia bacterium]
MVNTIRNYIIDKLYQWITNYKERDVVRDTTRIKGQFDFFIESSVTDPLSFTVFEMTEKGELIVDDPARLVGSQAAFFLFVNVDTKWIVAVKNNTKNQAKLIRKEPLEHFKIKLIA